MNLPYNESENVFIYFIELLHLGQYCPQRLAAALHDCPHQPTCE